MIRKILLLDLFNTTCIQRWNDKLRPVDLVELDFQAHRMMIAYFLGKFEKQDTLDWVALVEGGIFDLLEAMVLTDLKWNVKEELKRKDQRDKVNAYLEQELRPLICDVGEGTFDRFKQWQMGNGGPTQVRKVLRAASSRAREQEIHILEQANPHGYEISHIKSISQKDLERHNRLKGCQELNNYQKYRTFVEICGELRFQKRWSHLHISPRPSVLGHSMFVATVAYLFSLEVKACKRQRVNMFYSGLFHDLAETQTRDVRSPLKKAIPILDDVLEEIGRDLMEKEVIGRLPQAWHEQFRLFSLEPLHENFAAVEPEKHPISNEDVLGKYNSDEYNPRCGYLVKAADDLAAYIEADQGIKNGCNNIELSKAKSEIGNKYQSSKCENLDLGLLYRELEK